ncbi:MAG: Ig-like domain-containing protein, partial [Planctomycetota bacterium]
MERLEARLALDGGLAELFADAFEVRQNSQPIELDVLANDLFDGEYEGAGKISSVSYGSEGGVVGIGADGKSLRYAPPADYFGVETFVYVVDGEHTAEVQIDVQPLLAFDEYTIAPNGDERLLEVLANDPFWDDYEGPREITSVSVSSAGGIVEIDDDRQAIHYTPPDGAYGKDEFIYIVDELYPARVTVSIPQTLEADRFEIVQNASETFFPLANDPFWANYPGERRITHVVDSHLEAAIEISPDGQSITYTPPADQSGWDGFRYVVDGTYEASISVAIQRPVQDDWFETDLDSTEQRFNVIANDRYRDLNHV